MKQGDGALRCTMGGRAFVTTAAAGVAGLIGGRPASAAEATAGEQANMRLVNDFCAAWPSHDLEKLLSFFAETGTYRMTETTEPAKGRRGRRRPYQELRRVHARRQDRRVVRLHNCGRAQLKEVLASRVRHQA